MNDFSKEMVERVDWFSPIDYEILMFFDDHDIYASAKVVSANIGYSRNYANRRFSKLRDAGILEKDAESGLYGLSDQGKQFLAGDLDADDLSLDD